MTFHLGCSITFSMVTGISEIRVYPARPDQLPEILDVVESANPHLHARLSRCRLAGGSWADAMPMLCEKSGRVQSVAVIFHRTIWTAVGFMAFGGIGAVATRPGMQGRGFAGAVLEACEQQLASEGFALAVLFCSIAPFYKRLGWNVAPLPDLALPSPQAEARLRFERVLLSDVTPEIRALYDTSASGAIVRSREVWRDYNFWLREDKDLFQAAYTGDRLLGYARARRCADGLELLEATGKAVPALLFELLRIAGKQRFLPPSSVMMIKQLAPARPSTSRNLSLTDFENGLPWKPRTWWPIDRF